MIDKRKLISLTQNGRSENTSETVGSKEPATHIDMPREVWTDRYSTLYSRWTQIFVFLQSEELQRGVGSNGGPFDKILLLDLVIK